MRALRRRFSYPCADVVSQRPAVDAALDTALWSLGVNRSRPLLSPREPARTIAVLGFPRSGNTFLEAWVRWLALPSTEVLDGRLTHSVLDAYRLSRLGVTLLVPVRSPLPTCASWLVRSDSHDCLTAARETLRAYTAWYTAAARLPRKASTRIVRFRDFTDDPGTVTEWPALRGLIRQVEDGDVDGFRGSLHDELRDQPGQGQDLNGTPAHQMISLPSPQRRPLLEDASALLQDTRLSVEREAAARAFAALDARADLHQGADRLIS